MDDVRATLAEIDAASERVVATAAKLTDEDLRAPSRLPGWTRGHVLAHLARNADSYWNLLEWARTGHEVPQYLSDELRDTGIEASAGRPATELRTELRISMERFAHQARTLPASKWNATVRARAGWAHPAHYTLGRRWRELEAHHVDLNSGYSTDDWPPAYIGWELSDTLASLHAHGGVTAGRIRATDLDVDVHLGEGPEISGTAHELVGWLSSRALATPPTWPTAPRWPLPAAWNEA